MTRPKAILTMDGGGPNNLLTTILLQRIENERPGFLRGIDVISGTSSGSVTTLILGASKDRVAGINQAVSVMKDSSSTVGPHPIPQALLGLTGTAPFLCNKQAQEFFSSLFGTLTMKDLHLPTIIPAFQLDNNAELEVNRAWRPVLLHNLDSIPSATPDLLVVDAYLRTTAVPIMMPPYQGFIDGGYFADNPAMAALALVIEQSRRITGRPRRAALADVMVLSLGTGRNPLFLETTKESEPWGYLKWLLDPSNPFAALTAVFDGSQEFVDYLCQSFLEPEAYFRLDPPLSIQTPSRDALALEPDQHQSLLQKLEGIAMDVPLQPVLAWLDQAQWCRP
nr:patatin-like phospholipase family protein [Myxococcaceae bacterium MCy9487]